MKITSTLLIPQRNKIAYSIQALLISEKIKSISYATRPSFSPVKLHPLIYHRFYIESFIFLMVCLGDGRFESDIGIIKLHPSKKHIGLHT